MKEVATASEGGCCPPSAGVWVRMQLVLSSDMAVGLGCGNTLLLQRQRNGAGILLMGAGARPFSPSSIEAFLVDTLLEKPKVCQVAKQDIAQF